MTPDLSRLFSLDGRTAVVTGASRGLGRAMAEAIAAAGADVALVSSHPGGTSETAESVRALGRKAWSFAADFSDRAAVAVLFEQVTREVGDVHVLVNNAGTIRRHPADAYPIEDWDAVVEPNLTAVWALCQAFGRAMLARGAGKIVNVASLLSFQGGITVPAYTASKHAVAGLTKALANEWAGRGVGVNAIAPGYFATDNTQALRDNPEREPAIRGRIPAGRWGTP
ncbi:MAG TPA: SDR family NAD(P)-dependent oxidoreductase, partial [Rhodothermales bacterium]|nr:SDR family NAD(P)-dependent oxidoreductase [Rhodothermales bacterium]